MHKYSEQKHSENCEYTPTYLDLTLYTFNNRISELYFEHTSSRISEYKSEFEHNSSRIIINN